MQGFAEQEMVALGMTGVCVHIYVAKLKTHFSGRLQNPERFLGKSSSPEKQWLTRDTPAESVPGRFTFQSPETFP